MHAPRCRKVKNAPVSGLGCEGAEWQSVFLKDWPEQVRVFAIAECLRRESGCSPSFPILLGSKTLKFTESVLMYQPSRSRASGAGIYTTVEPPSCTFSSTSAVWKTRLKGQVE